jgi:hypothetical protein
MLGACRSMTNSNDILPNLNGEIVYVSRVPRIIPVYRAALRKSRQFTAEKKAKRQQQRPDSHIETRNTRTAQLYSGSGGLHPPYAVGSPPAARCREFDEKGLPPARGKIPSPRCARAVDLQQWGWLNSCCRQRSPTCKLDTKPQQAARRLTRSSKDAGRESRRAKASKRKAQRSCAPVALVFPQITMRFDFARADC